MSPTSLGARVGRFGQRGAVAALVVVAFVGLALLARGAPAPRIFPDELIYMDAASSIADGRAPTVRGADYEYGPLYPAIAAPLVRLAADREGAFPLVQLLNALLFALTAVPVFLLARRAVSSGWALVAASLAVLVPSSVYVSGVLTESAAYLVFACALVALLRVAEEATVARQLVGIALVAAAAATRTQFLVLLVALPVAALASRWLLPGPSRAPLSRLWPLAVLVALGAVIVVGLVTTGRSPADLLGSYDVLWSNRDAGDLARALLDHVGLLTLYLAVVPVVVAPVELRRWWRLSRSGSAAHAALLSVTLVVTGAMLVAVAVFASSTYARGELHDRALFYLAPLWIVVLCGWLASGMARPRGLLLVGSLVAIGLVVAIPYAAGGIVWETVALEPWQFVERGNPSGSPFSGREAMVGFSVLAVAAAAAVPRASRWVLVGLVGGVFAFAGALAWGHAREGARSVDGRAFESGQVRGWVDAAGVADATLVTVPRGCRREIDEASARLTEFFSDVVEAGASVGPADPLAPPGIAVEIVPGPEGWGTLVRASDGRPLRATSVVVRAGIEVRGVRVASGARAPFTLWRVDGATVDVKPTTAPLLLATGCSGGS